MTNLIIAFKKARIAFTKIRIDSKTHDLLWNHLSLANLELLDNIVVDRAEIRQLLKDPDRDFDNYIMPKVQKILNKYY